LKANKLAKTKAEEQLINDNLLAEYWDAADRIIMRFIENDGGPKRKLSEAYDWLDKVSSLLAHESLSSDAKMDFVDEAVWEFGRDIHGDFMGLTISPILDVTLTMIEDAMISSTKRMKPSYTRANGTESRISSFSRGQWYGT